MDILGIGMDIVDIKRFKDLIERWGERFLERLFTTRELKDTARRKGFERSLAGTFAAKEAFIKALGGRWGLSWRDMEVVRDRRGRPILNFDTSKMPFQVGKVHLSISHDGEYVLASCIVEGGSEDG